MSKAILGSFLVVAIVYSIPAESKGCRIWKDVSRANIQSGFSGQMRKLRSTCLYWQQRGFETKISYVRNLGRNSYYKCRVGYLCRSNSGKLKSR